jgi:predicted ATPase
MAAKKAEAANATDTALQYVANGQKLLSAAIWSSHFDLSFEVCTRAAEYAYLSGDAQRSQREFLAVESQLRNFDQLTQYFTLRCSQAEMLGIPFDGKNEALVEKLMASTLEAE